MPSNAQKMRNNIYIVFKNIFPPDIIQIISEFLTCTIYINTYKYVLKQINNVDTHSDDVYWKVSNFNLNSLLISSYIHSPWRYPHLAKDGHSSRVTRFLRLVEETKKENYISEMIKHDYEYNLIF